MQRYYNFSPDYTVDDFGLSAAIDPDGFLSGTAESLILFAWDGQSDVIKDVDYFQWGATTYGINKSNIPGYLSTDYDVSSQSFIPPELIVNDYSFERNPGSSINEFEIEAYGREKGLLVGFLKVWAGIESEIGIE